jgi:hypothetical protein
MANNPSDADRGERVWGGDWQAKLRSRLRSLGFEKIQDFLAQFPSEPYLKLVKRLGEDVAPLQLIWEQFREAQQQGRIRAAAKDCLAREITGQLRHGWGKGVRVDFQTAGAYANWVTELTRFQPDVRPMADAVWRTLNELKPPPGWLPVGPDDPHIAAAFAAGWPDSDENETQHSCPNV